MKIQEKCICLTVFAAIIVALFTIRFCVNNDSIEKQSPSLLSKLFYNNNSIIYNNTSGDVCRFDLSDSKASVVVKARRLVSAADKMLCDDNGVTEVYDYDGTMLHRIESLSIKYGEVRGNILYYIDSNDDKVKVYDIYSGQGNSFFNIDTQSFCLSEEYLYYEKDDGIFEINITTGKINRVFYGIYPYWFCVDEGILYISDYMNDSKISAITPDGGICNVDVKSIRFCVHNNCLYYIEYVAESDFLSIPQNEREIVRINTLDLENIIKPTE